MSLRSLLVEDDVQFRRRDDRKESNNSGSDQNGHNDSSDQIFKDKSEPDNSWSSTQSLSPTSTTVPALDSTTIPATITPTSSPASAALSTTTISSAAPSSASSQTTTIVIAVVATGAGVALILLVLFYFYRILCRRRQAPLEMGRPQRLLDQDTSSRFWGSSQSASTTAGEIPPSVPAMVYTGSGGSSVVDRQERLWLVRPSLLRPQEQEVLDKRTPSSPSEWDAQMQKEGQGNKECVNWPKANWRGDRISTTDMIEIEGGGSWEAPITVAARSARTESVSTAPRWREPVMWVRDQVNRNTGRTSELW